MKKKIIGFITTIHLLLPLGAHADSTYVVASQDTLYSIAKRFQVSVAQLCSANELSQQEILVPGMLLQIPDADVAPAREAEHPEQAHQTEEASPLPTPPQEAPKPQALAPKNQPKSGTLARLPRPHAILEQPIEVEQPNRSSALSAIVAEAPPNQQPEKSHNIALERVQKQKRKHAQLASRSNQSMRYGLLGTATSYLGTPYVMGGTSRNGIDCSAFVMRVFQAHGSQLPRTADAQYYSCQPVSSQEAKAGDLVFFETYLPGPSHVGIYMGNNQFIHASSSRGVTVSKLSNVYWAPRFLGFRRI